MAKKKSKLKKIGAVLAAGLGAAALMNRRKQNNQMKEYLSTEGGDTSSILGPLQKQPLITDDGFITRNNPFGEGGAKKGGCACRK